MERMRAALEAIMPFTGLPAPRRSVGQRPVLLRSRDYLRMRLAVRQFFSRGEGIETSRKSNMVNTFSSICSGDAEAVPPINLVLCITQRLHARLA